MDRSWHQRWPPNMKITFICNFKILLDSSCHAKKDFVMFPNERIKLILRIGQKDVDRIANSVDPDQTALLEAVWSGSTLFAQTCLSEILRTLW